jgi:hypothetical protein
METAQTEEKVLQINIVSASEIVDTGRVSFKFIFDSKMPYKDHQKVGKWGYLFDDKDGSGVILNVFESTNGLAFGWGNESLTEEWFSEVIKEDIPSCTLLMNEAKAEFLTAYLAKRTDVTYTYHHFVGELRTA